MAFGKKAKTKKVEIDEEEYKKEIKESEEQVPEPTETEPQEPTTPKPEEPKQKFNVFATPQRIGIVDTETKEIIGEGEAATLEVLATILNKLDEIEKLAKEE